jgi:hypothetical protein
MSKLNYTEKLQKLSENHKAYDLQVGVGAATMNGQKAGLISVSANLAIFEHTDKGPIVIRKSSASSEAKTLEKAQNDAIEKALILAGVV